MITCKNDYFRYISCIEAYEAEHLSLAPKKCYDVDYEEMEKIKICLTKSL